MRQYVEIASVAVLVAAPLVLALLVPLVAWTYRSRRRPTLLGTAAAAAAVLYVVALWAYTVLPAPTGNPCTGPQVEPQLTPLAFLGDLSGPGLAVTALNVLLFVPLGVGVVAVVRGRPALVAALVGLAVSLTIELVQLTGSAGLYDCAYRLFDVDDLVTNTVGAALGSLAAPLVRAYRRSRAEVPAERVTARRRLLGTTVDAFVLLSLAVGLVVAVVVAGQAFGPRSVPGRLADDGFLRNLLVLGVPSLALLLVLPTVTGGTTPGRWVVLLRAVDPHDRRPGPARAVAGALAGSGGVALAWTARVAAAPPYLALVIGAWVLLGLVLVVRGDHRGLSGRVCGVTYVDARALDRRTGAPDWTEQTDPDTAVRALSVGLALAYVALVGAFVALADLGAGRPVALVPVVGTLAASQVVASGFLVVNGVQMLRRESRSLGNLLSLLAGLASAGLVVLGVLALLEGPDLVQALVVAASVVASYLSSLFAGFVLLGRRFGRAPVNGAVSGGGVLGSRVIGTRVPPLLAGRLGAARQVWDEVRDRGEDPLLVPSGGQGAGESVAEGEAMAGWLVDTGVPRSAVLVEDRARTTRENLELSLALLHERRRPGRPVVVTSGYHVLRAATIAKDLGVDVALRAAPTSRYFLPSALLREFVAVLLRDRVLHGVLVVALAGLSVVAVVR